MSKSIKVSEELHNQLHSIKEVDESYADVVKRLLVLWSVLTKVEPLIHGTYNYLKAQKEAREKHDVS